jgi:hypothetical protein
MSRTVEFGFEIMVWLAIGSLIATLTYSSSMFTSYSIDLLKVDEVANRFTRYVSNAYCLEGLRAVFSLEPGFLINISCGSVSVCYRNFTKTFSSLPPIANTVLAGGRSYIIYFNGEAVAFMEVS